MTDDTKTCPYCAETIKAAAVKCRYCQSDLSAPRNEPHSAVSVPLSSGSVRDPIALAQTTWTVTQAAREKLLEVVGAEPDPGIPIRIVAPIANDGQNFVLFFDDRHLEGDHTVIAGLLQFRVDQLSWPHLHDLTVDWLETGFFVGIVPDEPEQSPAPDEPWEYASSGVPLVAWKGISKMTRQDTLPAYCSACGHDWLLDSQIANTIAQEQGLGGKLQRGGTRMEQFGATFSPFSAGRRIAAGNELQRQGDFLGSLYTLAACPRCRSSNILLAKP